MPVPGDIYSRRKTGTAGAPALDHRCPEPSPSRPWRARPDPRPLQTLSAQDHGSGSPETTCSKKTPGAPLTPHLLAARLRSTSRPTFPYRQDVAALASDPSGRHQTLLSGLSPSAGGKRRTPEVLGKSLAAGSSGPAALEEP